MPQNATSSSPSAHQDSRAWIERTSRTTSTTLRLPAVGRQKPGSGAGLSRMKTPILSQKYRVKEAPTIAELICLTLMLLGIIIAVYGSL